MSKNIHQIYLANPITSNTSTDLMYFGQSPYGGTNDAAMTYANFSAQFQSPLTLPLSLAQGGTGASLTANSGGIFYSTGSAGAILGGTATADQVLLSGSSSAPTWSTATYPATTTINRILFSSANNVISEIATANSGALITSAGGVPSISSTLPTAVQSNITQLGAQSQALNMNSHLINNVTDPVSAQDAATKHYVDQAILTGTSVYAASAASLGTVTQAGSGVGATLTNAGTQATFALDGVNPPLNSNVLIKNTATGMTSANEGIYTVTNVGSGATNWVLTRATTYDTPAKINSTGLIIVQNGSTLAGTAWYNSSTIVTVDTTAFNYNQFGNIIFPISLMNGGTGASLTANNGGIFYSNASTGAILAGTATAGQILRSGSSSAPSWSTATYPSTAGSSGKILISDGTNIVSSTPTYPNASVTAGKVIISDGTNYIASTSIFPNTVGSAGTIIRSDGTSNVYSTSTFADTYAVSTILYASSANTVTGLATANNGVLITSAGGVPSISSTLPAAVQGNITSVGTIASGTWQGSVIGPTYGGTGVNNGSSTITIGGNVTFSGGFTFTGTITNTTSVTFPTSGTLATTSQLPSLPLSLSNGGTGASLTANNGGIFYSTGSAGAILAGTATSNQVLLSGSSTTPSWSSATYPASTTINQLLYSSSSNVIAGLATANNGVLITGGTGIPSISSTLPSAVQGNITSLGTITSGTWNGSVITGTYGGTGVNNGSSLITVGGNVTFSGAFATTLTVTNTTSVTLPTSGTLATTSQLPTPAALTVGNDTNVTLTLGGTPATALLQAASVTAGWTGTLSGTRGGTGVNNGASTITIGGNVTFSGAHTFTGTVTADTAVTFPTSGTLATTTQVITSNNVTTTSATLAANNLYVANNAGLVTLTLPSTAAVGDIIYVRGGGAGGWKVAQNASGIIHVGSSATTTGTGGSIASSNRYDCVDLTCIVANNEWVCNGVQGNLTIV